MASLAARLLGARLTVLPHRLGSHSLAQRLSLLKPRRRGREACLLILPSPATLYECSALDGWQGRFGHVGAWIIDSFWHGWIPRLARLSGAIDHYFVTNPEDVAAWRRRTGRPTSVLEWGTDALHLGSEQPQREVDLQRVGRQPPQWDDDAASLTDAAALGVRFAGRPPMFDDPRENQAALMSAFSRAKFTLSFSNTVDRYGYTHSRREYITARWADALGAGAVVAGIPPRCEVVQGLLWSGALLRFRSAERKEGLHAVREALASWTPATAARNHRLALLRLDWRWRIARVAAHFDVTAPLLDAELASVRARASAVDPAKDAAGLLT